jgi:hypothetical protein
MSTAVSTLSTLSPLTRELAVELVPTLDADLAPDAPTLQPAAWLPVAVEALQAFRHHL